MSKLCERVQAVTGQTVRVGFVDPGYTGKKAGHAVAVHDIDLQIIREPKGRTGSLLLPRRWVVERSFAWLSQVRRLARDYERLRSTLQQPHFVFFACIMLDRHATSA